MLADTPSARILSASGRRRARAPELARAARSIKLAIVENDSREFVRAPE
jgi:hypothetical protein